MVSRGNNKEIEKGKHILFTNKFVIQTRIVLICKRNDLPIAVQ